MPLIVSGFNITLAGRVRETTQTIGTGPYSLDGAPTGKRTFIQGIGGGNFTFYTTELGANWETGIGEITVAPGINRSLVLESSNGNNPVNWPTGVKDIFLDLAAAGLHSLQDQISNAAFANRIVSTVRTTTGTFTRNSDCLFARVRIVAGGGAGGGTPATGAGENVEAGGGGGGEYAEGWFTAAQIGTSQSVTIGIGGVGDTGGGNTGGTTSFGSLMTAIGGTGGAVGIPTTTSLSTDSGVGGTGGAGGLVRVQGSAGGPGVVRSGLRLHASSGGGTPLGGMRAGIINGNGLNGLLYGGGGTGANEDFSSGARIGGSGAPGVCIIDEFCKA